MQLPADAATAPPPTPHLAPSGCSAAGGGASRRRGRTAIATLGPLLSVLLFLAAIISAFWYLRNEEIEREQEAVKRDTEIAQQQIRLRLIENQEQLVRMARELVTRTIDRDDFLAQAASFTRERPEITQPDLGRRRPRSAERQLLGDELPAGDRHQRRSTRRRRCRSRTPAASPRRPSARARDLRQPVVLARLRRQRGNAGVPGRRSR